MSETLTHPNPEQTPKPYEPIALELSQGDVDTAMELYLDFTRLPKEQRERIFHFDEARPRTGASGYEHKGKFSESGKPLQDNKHVFHFTQDIEQRFLQPGSIDRQLMPHETKAFLEVARELYYSIARSTERKYKELEEDFPALVGIHFPKDGTLAHHMRFLAYQRGNDGVLARGHYDKGTGTVAVAESHGGLRLGHGEHDLTALDRNQYDPVFFRGYGWHQLAEMMDVDTREKAAWHDVVETGEQVDEDTMRWALVYFVDPAKMYLESSTEQTHTPINWRGPNAPQSLHRESFLRQQ